MNLWCVYLNCVHGGDDGDGGADMAVGTAWLDGPADWSSVYSHGVGSEVNRLHRESYCCQRNKRSPGSKYTNHLETHRQKKSVKPPGLIPD